MTVVANCPAAVSPRGVALLQRFEGCRLRAYRPTADDVPTIGWGSTRHADGAPVALGDRCTQAEADTLLATTLSALAHRIATRLHAAPTQQPQFDAIACLAYNIGFDALSGSSLLAHHLAGDFAAAADGFARWRFARGRELPGLVARRAAEAALYRMAA